MRIGVTYSSHSSYSIRFYLCVKRPNFRKHLVTGIILSKYPLKLFMYVYPVYRHAILAICACVSVCMSECVCVSGGVLHVIRRRPTLKVMKNESFAIRS